MVIALLGGDTEGFVNSLIALGATSSKTDKDKLIEDAEMFLSGYANTTSISDMDMSDLFDEITELTSKHHISLPGQFTMLGRAIISIEGVIEQLSPELDLFKLLSDKMIERSKKSFDIKKTLLDAGKDLIGIGKKTAKIPVYIADTLYSLSKGKTKINMEITGIDEPLERIGAYFRYVVLAFIACILFIGSCILATVDIQPKTSNGMPLIAMAGIVFSISLAIYSVGQLTKKKNN